MTSDSGTHGKLIADADGVRPHQSDDPGNVTPLVDVCCDKLGHEPWKIQFPDTNFAIPTLVINKDIEDWNALSREPNFRSIVMSSVMRQILTHIIFIEKITFDEENPEDWQQKWLYFAAQFSSPGKLPVLAEGEDQFEEIEEWISEAVSGFSGKFNFLHTLMNSNEGN